MARETSSASTNSNIKGVLTNGGKYARYNLYGNLFEVSSKYVPPIRPIGRGAYGLVWLVRIHPLPPEELVAWTIYSAVT